MFNTMKSISQKLSSLNEVQWALIGIGLMLVTFAVLAVFGVYKLDVLPGGV